MSAVTDPVPDIFSAVGVVVLYFVLQIALGLGLSLVWVMLAGHDGSGAARGAALPEAADARAMLLALTVTVAAVAMALFIRWRWKSWWSVSLPPGFGLVSTPVRAWLPAIAVGVLVALAGGLLTQWLAGGQPVQQDVTVMSARVSMPMRVMLAVLVTLVAPWVEELIFRGVLLSALLSRMRAGFAVPVSALVFGMVHLADFGFGWHAIPALVGLGLVLAWLRLRGRSLWPAVVAHAANNALAAAGWFLVAS